MAKTKREWLADKNLAIPGARGKFSRDAIAALKAEEERCEKENIPLPWIEKEKPVPSNRGRKTKVSKGITQFEKSQGVVEDETALRPGTNFNVIVSAPKRREETEAWVIDQNGFRIGIMFCGKCQKSISRCIHDVPYAPEYLGGGLASLTRPVTD